jgi:hypothetical protein
MPTEFHFDDLDLREEPHQDSGPVSFFTGSSSCRCTPSDNCCFCSSTIC